jgi:hypothetical protein
MASEAPAGSPGQERTPIPRRAGGSGAAPRRCGSALPPAADPPGTTPPGPDVTPHPMSALAPSQRLAWDTPRTLAEHHVVSCGGCGAARCAFALHRFSSRQRASKKEPGTIDSSVF